MRTSIAQRNNMRARRRPRAELFRATIANNVSTTALSRLRIQQRLCGNPGAFVQEQEAPQALAGLTRWELPSGAWDGATAINRSISRCALSPVGSPSYILNPGDESGWSSGSQGQGAARSWISVLVSKVAISASFDRGRGHVRRQEVALPAIVVLRCSHGRAPAPAPRAGETGRM